jgi:hypothetical protein
VEETPPEPSPEPVVEPTPAPVVEPPPAEATSGLKLADKPEEKGSAKPADDVIADEPSSGGDMILLDEAYEEPVADTPDGDAEEEVGSVEDVASGTTVVKKRAGEPDGVRRVNRLLLVAVLLILALIGIEIWANISAKPLPAPEPGEMMLPEEVDTSLVPLTDVVGSLEEKEWFYVAEPIDDGNGEDPTPKPSAVADFLKQNVKLVGLSKLPDGSPEALIADLIPDKMHFVQQGDRLALGSPEAPRLFTLKNIARDHVILSDGSDEYELK